jgi:hydrogenase nickel incorporation protein HypA/HybF
MHERSLMAGLMRQIEAVTQEQGAARATRIHVRLGALAHFSPEHFREHFHEASNGTAAEGARVEIAVSDDLTSPDAQDVLLESLELEIDEA